LSATRSSARGAEGNRDDLDTTGAGTQFVHAAIHIGIAGGALTREAFRNRRARTEGAKADSW